MLTFAKGISFFLGPVFILLPIPFILVAKFTQDYPYALKWTVFSYAFMLAVVLFIVIGVFLGFFSNLDVSKREQRPLLFAFCAFAAFCYLLSLIILDGPKILFDVVDEFRSIDRYLVYYANIMGISIKETGILFDARQSEVVAAVDRDGKTVAYKPIRDVMVIRVKPSTPPAEVLLKPVVAKIWEILETQYGGDPEQMALDLGLPVEEMQAILQGKGWINARWFLNRLATLLYRNRDELVAIYNGERNLGDARVIDADIALLEGAMAVYEKREGKIAGELVIEGNPGWGEQRVVISKGALRHFSEHNLSDVTFRGIWQGLMSYFCIQKDEEWMEKMEAHFFERQQWTREAGSAREKLLLLARQLSARRFGDILPQHPNMDDLPAQTSVDNNSVVAQ